MDDHLSAPFNNPNNLNHFHSPDTPHYPFSGATWPMMVQQPLSDPSPPAHPDTASQSPTSIDYDIKPNMTSPVPLNSPQFTMAQPSSTLRPAAPTSSTMGLSPSMATSMSSLQLAFNDGQPGSDLRLRTALGTSQGQNPSAELAFQQALEASTTMLQTSPLQFAMSAFAPPPPMAFTSSYDLPLHSSPTDDFLPTSQAPLSGMEAFLVPGSLDAMPVLDSLAGPASTFPMSDFSHLVSAPWQPVMMGGMPFMHNNMVSGSPDNVLDSRSYSSRSDGSWSFIDVPSGRQSLDAISDSSNVVSPQILHVRSDSDSSGHSDNPPPSAHSRSSYDDMLFPVSPEPDFPPPQSVPEYPFAISPISSRTQRQPAATPVASGRNSLDSTSSSSSPKSKRRTSPSGITPKLISKKKSPAMSAAKDKAEKRVGRRKGPLKPEQRQSAHEIRKLRACLRCKFLKKVCDKGEPCTGCQPSHARLWQVPCTRLDIKEIGYFLKDWNVDYKRHITLGFSVTNIKGFGLQERCLYVTHGYGYCMPIWAREVSVRDDTVFGLDWVENLMECPREFEVVTAKLSCGKDGVSRKMVSDYVDLHLESGFDNFVASYFEGTPFLTELLMSINRYYVATKQQNIGKGLRLVIAYGLTLHVSLVNGLSDEEAEVGKITDPNSRYYGETCAPVMINFQVKEAMASLWRDLMKECLEELSALYSSVYNGEKFKNWPSIFMQAALILSVWEMMQFDCYYRDPDYTAVNKFCNDMEHVPVGVIVGLFGAISTKLPTFLEWDTEKHGQVWQGNPSICNTMTEVRGHIEKHGMLIPKFSSCLTITEEYLRTRNEAKFERDDFDSLSNKFLSKLVIRS